jgi:hypothetical protein
MDDFDDFESQFDDFESEDVDHMETLVCMAERIKERTTYHANASAIASLESLWWEIARIAEKHVALARRHGSVDVGRWASNPLYRAVLESSVDRGTKEPLVLDGETLRPVTSRTEWIDTRKRILSAMSNTLCHVLAIDRILEEFAPFENYARWDRRVLFSPFKDLDHRLRILADEVKTEAHGKSVVLLEES